jgi:3-methyladenine DNA glycosylase AlkD
MKKWAKSKNMWLRRASVVSLIIPARKGLFLEESFELSNILMKDEEDLVQKGYGWLLKVLSETHTKEVFNFVIKNKNEMTRTALRYAIEKMPQDLRQKAMS